MSQIPELLSPAGSLEKLQIAVLYGADAVYVGGMNFGLRVASDNLTDGELASGVDFAHRQGVKVFVVLNGFLHDEDIASLPPFCGFLESIGVDAVICSDLGVIETVRSCSSLPIHLSTQASCLNAYSGKLWKRGGVTRLILGREVSLDEAQRIKEQTGLEIELFVHGSMCSSYSGNCVISNYTAGRDSNRGGCAHSCRFQYTLKGSRGEEVISSFMSSKDLQGLEVLGSYIRAGVDSIKIEGRMKGPLYVATSTKVYREALDRWPWSPSSASDMDQWQRELETFSHRDYTTASLLAPAGTESLYTGREETKARTREVLGVVMAFEGEEMIVKVKNAFDRQSQVEVLPFSGEVIPVLSQEMRSLGGKPLMRALPSTVIRLPRVLGVEQWNVLRGVM